MKKLGIILFLCIFVFCSTSCGVELFRKKVEIYNPTSKPVTIKALTLFKTEDGESINSDVVIPAFGRETYYLSSVGSSSYNLTLFINGAFYGDTFEKFTVQGLSSQITLVPKCSLITIKNMTSYTLNSVSFNGHSADYDEELNKRRANSSISAYGSGLIQYDGSTTSSTVSFYIGSKLYRTKTSFTPPLAGETKTICIYSSDLY